MSRSQAATLRIVALDTYQRQLVAAMLALLNPRLGKSWSVTDLGDADAMLVDVDSDRGRHHAEQRAREGLAHRTIVLGDANELHDCHALPKPLRLHPLLAALSEIESTPAWAQLADTTAVRFRLAAWPKLDAYETTADELRIFATLTRRALSIAELSRILDLAPARVADVIERLRDQELLMQSATNATFQPVHAASNRSPDRGLIAMLRRRFGL